MSKKSERIEEKADKYQEKIVQISRVTKVVKGGKNMSFRATVIVGDGEGNVGIGLGKSIEVPKAIRKGIEKAKKKQVNVPLVGTTIPHEIVGKHGASKVFIKPAPPGTGVIAGSAIRSILELAGVKDVVAKSQGSSNIINTARATLNAFSNMLSEEKVKELRGVKVSIKTYEKENARKGI